MSVKIRLSRHGAKKQAFYRIVVADSRYPRDGHYIEQIGTYDPALEPTRLEVKQEKLDKWLSVGARPTSTVATLFKRSGIKRSAAEPAPAPEAASA